MDYNDQSIFTHDPNAWDDSIILDIFKESVRNHQVQQATNSSSTNSASSITSKQPAKKQKRSILRNINVKQLQVTKEQLLTEAVAGAWEPVPVEASKNHSKIETAATSSRTDSLDDVNTYIQEVADKTDSKLADDNSNTDMNASSLLSHSAIAIPDAMSLPTVNNVFASHNQTIGNYSISIELEKAREQMLAASYQSGYATGRYYTLLEIANKQQERKSND